MAPKKSLKRRPEDADADSSSSGPSRKAKRPPKMKGKKEPTYDTYDDALDGGVEMEEKGERYRDGDKVCQLYAWSRNEADFQNVQAQRFYEKALELYNRAYEFNPTYDAAYNE